MDKAELNSKLGYDNELLKELESAFELQEDYNNYGWDKLIKICRYIYSIEQQLQKKQDVIDKAIEFMEKELGNISEYTGKFEACGDLDYAQDEVEELYRILKEVE